MSSSVPVLTRRRPEVLRSSNTLWRSLVLSGSDQTDLQHMVVVKIRSKVELFTRWSHCRFTSSASTLVFLLSKDCSKKVGANDEVLIASSSTTTSATSLQWRRVSTWCSRRWRWSSRRRLWFIPRMCQAARWIKLIVS